MKSSTTTPSSAHRTLHSSGRPAGHRTRRASHRREKRMKALYYDPAKYDTYLEQLGIKYPTVRATAGDAETK